MVYKYYGHELCHYGILGMKWGVRRYQNEDGTLTEAGKKRYNRDVQENLSKKTKKERMDLSSMSDKEMRDKINRELLEQQYDKPFNNVQTEETSVGRAYVRDALNDAGTVFVLAATALNVALAIKQLKG